MQCISPSTISMENWSIMFWLTDNNNLYKPKRNLPGATDARWQWYLMLINDKELTRILFQLWMHMRSILVIVANVVPRKIMTTSSLAEIEARNASIRHCLSVTRCWEKKRTRLPLCACLQFVPGLCVLANRIFFPRPPQDWTWPKIQDLYFPPVGKRLEAAKTEGRFFFSMLGSASFRQNLKSLKGEKMGQKGL